MYKIINLVNKKIYIGKSKDPQKRWRRHLATAKRGPRDRRFQPFHRAIIKYGEHNFLLEILGCYETEQTCLEHEVYFIKKYSSFKGAGYNCTQGGEGASGYRHSKKSIEKMKKAKAGKFSGENNPFYGKRHNNKTKQLLSKKASKRMQGKKNHFYERKHSDKSKDKMRKNSKPKKRYFSFEEAECIRETYVKENITYQVTSVLFKTTPSVIKNIITYSKAYENDKEKSKYFKSLTNNKRRFNFEQSEEIREIVFFKRKTIKELCNSLNVSRTTLSILVNFKKCYAEDYLLSQYKKH